MASGMELTIHKTSGRYLLKNISINGQPLSNTALYSVAMIDVPERIEALTNKALGPNSFEKFATSGEVYARNLWLDYLTAGNSIEKPTAYISGKGL